jgi:hypothetical protein
MTGADAEAEAVDDAVRVRVEFDGDGSGAGASVLATTHLDPADARALARQLVTSASRVEPREIEAGPEGDDR